MRVRLSVFYPLSQDMASALSEHLTGKLASENIEVSVSIRTDAGEVRAIVCSFEEVGSLFLASPLALDFLRNRVRSSVAKWAGPGIRIILSNKLSSSTKDLELQPA